LRYLALIALVFIFGCTTPKAVLPNIPNDEQIYDIDFSKIRISFQPIVPNYPKDAKEKRIQGTVVVLCSVDRSGIPFRCEAIEGPQELRKDSESYLMDWRFRPTIIDQQPRKVKFKIIMPFRLK